MRKSINKKKKKNWKRTLLIAVIAVIMAAFCAIAFWAITFALQFVAEKLQYCANAMLEDYELFGLGLFIVLSLLYFKILVKPKSKKKQVIKQQKQINQQRSQSRNNRQPVKPRPRPQGKPKSTTKVQPDFPMAHRYKA